MTKLSDILRDQRKSLGLKQKQIAHKLRITQQGYSKIENNPEMLTLSRLNQVCDILKIKIDLQIK
jgi:transcriptional regulator with XRE-family HTH domain